MSAGIFGMVGEDGLDEVGSFGGVAITKPCDGGFYAEVGILRNDFHGSIQELRGLGIAVFGDSEVSELAETKGKRGAVVSLGLSEIAGFEG